MALCNNKLYIIIYIYIMFSHIVPGVLQDANIILNKKNADGAKRTTLCVLGTC